MHCLFRRMWARGTLSSAALSAVLTQRRAAQLKAAEALSALAARSGNHKSRRPTEPLVSLLGDGRRVRRGTPQEVALVLSDLAKSGDNKSAICAAGAVGALGDALVGGDLRPDTRRPPSHSCGWQQPPCDRRGRCDRTARGSTCARLGRCAALVTLWHLASSADNKIQMVGAGIIPLLLPVLRCRSAEARDACAVFSALARTQGGNKKAIYHAGGIAPLTADARTQRHVALWGLSEWHLRQVHR